MNLAAMKRAILRRAAAWDGIYDEWDHMSRGDKYGRISKKQLEKNARVEAALKELEAEGLMEHVGGREWRVKS